MTPERHYELLKPFSTSERVSNKLKAEFNETELREKFYNSSNKPMVIQMNEKVLDDLTKASPKELELFLIHALISDKDFDDNYQGECTHLLKSKNSLIKFKFDDTKYVDNVVYIIDSKPYIKRKIGRHKGEYLELKHHPDFVKESDAQYPNRSAVLIMNVGGLGKCRITSIYHVSKDGRINISYDEDFKSKYKGKLKIDVGNHDLFFISCTDDVEKAKNTDTANLNILLDLTALKSYIPVLKYGYFDWLFVTTMKLNEERFMLDKTQLSIVPKLYMKNEKLCDLINSNPWGSSKVRLNASVETPRNIDTQSVYVPLQRVDNEISTLMITPGKLYFTKQHEYYNQSYIDHSYYNGIEEQYVVTFFYKDEIRILRVDEDLIGLTTYMFSSRSIKHLIDQYKIDQLNGESQYVVEGKATANRRRLIEAKVLENKRIREDEELKEKERVEAKQDIIEQGNKDRRLIQSTLRPGYKSPIERLIYLLNFNTYDIIVPIQYSGNMLRIANPFKAEEGNGLGGSSDNKHEIRTKTLRALQGNVNAKIIYRSGKVYDSRLRLTVDDLVVAEPVKGDTAALVFLHDDVEDCIINNTLIQLAMIPHRRVYHTKKGIERLTNGFKYVNNDLI